MKAPHNETFTDVELSEIRETVKGIMADEGLSQKAIAAAAGIAYGTLTGFLAGTYQGKNDRIAGEIQIWLSARREQAHTVAVIPKSPGFQKTPSAEGFMDVLRFAQIMPDITVIAGGPGVGKTTAVQQYAATNPNVWVATMEPCSSSVYTMLGAVGEAMGITERVQTKLSRAIGRKAMGSGGLIVIDEAQHLDSKALDQLRSIFDIYGVGIALVGNETVYSRLEGAGRTTDFAQLFSRVGMRVTKARPQAKDVCTLIEAWGITEKEQIKLLKAIASKPGALRLMDKCLKVAGMSAAGSGKSIAIEHIRAAYERLSSSPVTGAAA